MADQHSPGRGGEPLHHHAEGGDLRRRGAVGGGDAGGRDPGEHGGGGDGHAELHRGAHPRAAASHHGLRHHQLQRLGPAGPAGGLHGAAGRRLQPLRGLRAAPGRDRGRRGSQGARRGWGGRCSTGAGVGRGCGLRHRRAGSVREPPGHHRDLHLRHLPGREERGRGCRSRQVSVRNDQAAVRQRQASVDRQNPSGATKRRVPSVCPLCEPSGGRHPDSLELLPSSGGA
mmetsp:Transcript_11739/g.24609  ORF Transcript_11739/g.24609 Transcript_11739/m.24609 type:complete len:229 (-) Transcript_11739:518-1204(-)